MNCWNYRVVALSTLSCLLVALPAELSSAQDANSSTDNVEIFAPHPQIPRDDGFADGVSPSHVFAKLDRLDRSLDRLIAARNVPLPTFPQDIESGLQPMHVYQAVLSCVGRLQDLDDQLGVFAIPTIAVRPTTYAPRDVLFLVSLMLDNVRRIAVEQSINGLPDDELIVTGKTPTDVFARTVRVLLKLHALCGSDELRPAEVYAQMVRGVEDVKSILRQNDPACRYRIDAPRCAPNRRPADVLQKCLEIRTLINRHRRRLGMSSIPVPEHPGVSVRPRDVFLQTQIIIAELNLLKRQLNTVSSTPLPIPVDDNTTATDVCQKAVVLEYLLLQLGDLDQQTAVTSESGQKVE